MSLTWMKSRDCSPSSKMIGAPPVEQPRGEDRRHAGVRVRERLAGAVGVEEPQRHRGDAVGGPGDQAQLLVVALGDGVDRGGDQGLDLAGSDPSELTAAGGAAGLPLAREQLSLRAWRDGHQAVLGALVLALAVDRHRGGDHQPLGERALRHQLLEEDGGLHRVALGVAGDLVHRLADADRRRQVDDPIHARERAGCGKTSRRPPRRPARPRPAGRGSGRRGPAPRVSPGRRPRRRGDQLADKVAPDEACSARHQCPHSV